MPKINNPGNSGDSNASNKNNPPAAQPASSSKPGGSGASKGKSSGKNRRPTIGGTAVPGEIHPTQDHSRRPANARAARNVQPRDAPPHAANGYRSLQRTRTQCHAETQRKARKTSRRGQKDRRDSRPQHQYPAWPPQPLFLAWRGRAHRPDYRHRHSRSLRILIFVVISCQNKPGRMESQGDRKGRPYYGENAQQMQRDIVGATLAVALALSSPSSPTPVNYCHKI